MIWLLVTNAEINMRSTSSNAVASSHIIQHPSPHTQLTLILVASLSACGGAGSEASAPPPRSSATIEVSNAAGLSKAIAEALPGDKITLSAGVYAGSFVIDKSGSENQPITLTGTSDAVLQNTASTGKRYGLYLNGANYWIINGISINNSQKGIVTDLSNFNIFQNLTIYDVEDEAVHFRKNSSDNAIKNSIIYNTGLKQPQYGEGIYIGSSSSNWQSIMLNSTTPDYSNRNQVLNNRIGPNVTAESVDIREGTSGGSIVGNVFDTTGILGQNSADSAVDVKGDNYTLEGNTITNTPQSTNSCDLVIATRGNSNCLKDGFQIHINVIDSISYGYNNKFSKNTFNLNTTGPLGTPGYIPLMTKASQGYGINVPVNATGSIVCASNVAFNATGVSNINPTVCND
jgi:hypothetical protein